jgi:anti-sigma regulatory factor (Ser/Thr protein kinase)
VASITESRTWPGGHVVQFYEHEDELTETVGRYFAEGLVAGEVGVVIATPAHRHAFEARLAASGIDVAAAIRSGSLLMLDAEATTSKLVIDNRPDRALFDTVIGDVMRKAAATERAVRAYGEIVALLWDAGHVTAAIELEGMWNELNEEVPFSLFCGYPLASVRGDDNADAFNEVCKLHSSIMGHTASDAARTFEATLASPRAARAFVGETLAQWGYEGVCHDAAIVVAELAANAVMHARSSFTVALSARGDDLRIAVRDASTCCPSIRDAGMGFSGRGLRLVEATAARWGTDMLVDGKVVWAELRFRQ